MQNMGTMISLFSFYSKSRSSSVYVLLVPVVWVGDIHCLGLHFLSILSSSVLGKVCSKQNLCFLMERGSELICPLLL